MIRTSLLLLVLSLTLRAAETRDLILIAGQSNAVGADAKASELPADETDKNVMFWWRTGDPPPDEYDTTSGGKWTTLQPQPRGNPMPKDKGLPRQWGNFASPAGFGPEIGLARTLQAKEKKPLAIVKAAWSGTSMTQDWNHADAGPGGSCYRALVAEAKAALAAAKKNDITLRLRALVWVQGESDANAQAAPLYRQRLGEMITALRQDLAAPELIALVGVNTNFGSGKNPFMPVIIEQQKALAAGFPRCAYVDTSGLTYANAAHFDSKSTIEIGQRFAAALLQLEAK